MDAPHSTEHAEKPFHKIRHIVLSGGSIYGFTIYGILKELNQKRFWLIEDIESIYAISVGCMDAVIMALNIEWELTHKYLCERPLTDVANIDFFTVMNSFETGGLLGIRAFEIFFENLFAAKDIRVDITMKEFYELNKIDLHFYTTRVNGMVLVDVSHKTHPDWRVVEAVYSSCSIPFIFQPFFKDGEYYCDGGCILNHPIKLCLLNDIPPSEILSVSLRSYREEHPAGSLELNLLRYVIMLIDNVIKKLSAHFVQSLSVSIENEIENQLFVEVLREDIFKFSLLYSSEKRKELVEQGVQIAATFLKERAQKSGDYNATENIN